MASSNKRARKKDSEGEDRISNLPDSVLRRILSCLSTKDAVRTSVLSKRWAYVWTFINKLHFEDLPSYIKRMKKQKAGKKKVFVDFVFRVLFHLSSSNIESFCLLLSDSYDSSHVQAWISAILNRRVKILTIHYPHELTLVLPHTLFSCESLVALELQMHCTVRVPSCVHLPNLKTLMLSGVKLKNDSSSTSKDLAFSFPALKKFEVQSCSWSNVQYVSLQVPLLEVIVIKSHSKSDNCTLGFCASHLREFIYDGPPSQYITLSHPSSALSATISICLLARLGYDSEEKEEDTELETSLSACKLLSQFSQVKFLRLVESMVFARDFLRNIPTFEVLRHLELGLVTGEILIGLLQKSPNLTALNIKGVSKFDKELVDSTIVPDCVIATLQEVKLEKLMGYDDELRLAKFVMENAQVLEWLSFSPTCDLRSSKSKMAEVKKKLLSFKKCSNLTIIDFSDV